MNGFTVAARPAAQQQILDVWPKTSSGDLDLDRAPFALQAIVNRFDVRDPTNHSGGQGRVVYALTPQGFTFGEEFTVIIEFNLPAADDAAVAAWASRWHALASHPFPSEEYNSALEAITRSFTDQDPASSNVNHSNVLQLRTNDFLLSGFTRWELREFQLSPSTSGSRPGHGQGDAGRLVQQHADVLELRESERASDHRGHPRRAQQHSPRARSGGTASWQARRSTTSSCGMGPGINDLGRAIPRVVEHVQRVPRPRDEHQLPDGGPAISANESFLSPFLTGTNAFDPFQSGPGPAPERPVAPPGRHDRGDLP